MLPPHPPCMYMHTTHNHTYTLHTHTHTYIHSTHVWHTQLEEKRQGNKEGSRERHEKVAAAQAKIEVPEFTCDCNERTYTLLPVSQLLEFIDSAYSTYASVI